jgi:sporulation protein YlmC with PRC-barrel domain
LTDTSHGLVVGGRHGKKGVLEYNGYSRYRFEYDDIQIIGDYALLLRKRHN